MIKGEGYTQVARYIHLYCFYIYINIFWLSTYQKAEDMFCFCDVYVYKIYICLHKTLKFFILIRLNELLNLYIFCSFFMFFFLLFSYCLDKRHREYDTKKIKKKIKSDKQKY